MIGELFLPDKKCSKKKKSFNNCKTNGFSESKIRFLKIN